VGLVRRRLGGTGATGRRIGRARLSVSAAPVGTPIPDGAAGEFLGFDASEQIDAIAPSAVFEWINAASPPAGETYYFTEG
jgi:hypothetical protein